MNEDKIAIEFNGNEFDMIQKYANLIEAESIQTAVMNAISIAFDEADEVITIMDAIMFLQEYKRMCGQNNGRCEPKDCPIRVLLDRHRIETCDDAFIYLHPEEVVEAVAEWSNTHPQQTI